MFAPRWKDPDGDAGPSGELAVFAEVILQVLRDLASIRREIQYSNWLKVIELKSNGLYDDEKMRDDLKQFRLED
jgi:hypothetical protein